MTRRRFWCTGEPSTAPPESHVFAVLTRTGKPSILIDRGFLPTPSGTEAVASPTLSDTTVEGIVRPGTGKAWFDVANNPGKNQWFWIDPAGMARAAGVPSLLPTYIEATGPTGDATNRPMPTGDRLLGSIRNEHLNYAITWFSLAATLAAIYASWLWRAFHPSRPVVTLDP